MPVNLMVPFLQNQYKLFKQLCLIAYAFRNNYLILSEAFYSYDQTFSAF